MGKNIQKKYPTKELIPLRDNYGFCISEETFVELLQNAYDEMPGDIMDTEFEDDDIDGDDMIMF